MELKHLFDRCDSNDLYCKSSPNIRRCTDGRYDSTYYCCRTAATLRLQLAYTNPELIKEVNLVPDYFYPLLGGLSLAYGGTQYGYFNPDLGDGRSYIYGQVRDKDDNLYDIVVKGHVHNRFSRGNGFLSPGIARVEKYFGQELLNHGVPAEQVLYIYHVYNENDQDPYTAISVKLRRCSFRIGNLQLYYVKERLDLVEAVCDYLNLHYYHAATISDLFVGICGNLGELVKGWQKAGFVHGRLNSDNVSLVGETIDTASGGFTNNQDHTHRFHEDIYGHYSFGRQPAVIEEYLYILADCLRYFISSKKADEGIEMYRHITKTVQV